jgi:catechol 2,3-dioxygenase-like lactoylglutathione lyase family enzyme
MSGGPRLALDHVQVAAPPGREDDARRFYGGLLGLPELEQPPALADGALNVGMTEAFVPATKAHPGLRAASSEALDDLADRLAAEGYPVEWDDRMPGHRRFYTRDPFRNRLEILAAFPGPG